MNNLIKCEPQPVHSHDYWWWYGDKFMTDDSLQSYLFHDVWGEYLANVPDDVEDVNVELIDGVWYWVLDVDEAVPACTK